LGNPPVLQKTEEKGRKKGRDCKDFLTHAAIAERKGPFSIMRKEEKGAGVVG